MGNGEDEPLADTRPSKVNVRSQSEPPESNGAIEVVAAQVSDTHIDDEHFLDFPSAPQLSPVLTGNGSASNHLYRSPEQTTVFSHHKSSSHASKRSRSDVFDSPSILNTISPQLSSAPSWPFQTEHEARLVLYYIRNVAHWVRSCSCAFPPSSMRFEFDDILSHCLED